LAGPTVAAEGDRVAGGSAFERGDDVVLSVERLEQVRLVATCGRHDDLRDGRAGGVALVITNGRVRLGWNEIRRFLNLLHMRRVGGGFGRVRSQHGRSEQTSGGDESNGSHAIPPRRLWRATPAFIPAAAGPSLPVEMARRRCPAAAPG